MPLPRGGVPVPAEVAAALNVPLDLVLVRKTGVPDQPEPCLPANEAVYVSAHLPLLLRGFYFEGWHPTRRPVSLKTRSAVLERIHDGVHRDLAVDPEQIARAVLALLAAHLLESELENTKAVTPAPLRDLWPS